jgi:hypothetical protein
LGEARIKALAVPQLRYRNAEAAIGFDLTIASRTVLTPEHLCL